MNTKPCLLLCTILPVLVLGCATTASRAATGAKPRLTVDIYHSHKSNQVLTLAHTNSPDPGGVANNIEWRCDKKAFSVVLPLVTGWIWTTDGTTNTTTGLFDPNTTVVIDCAPGKVLHLVIAHPPDNMAQTHYHIAVKQNQNLNTTGQKALAAPYYNYDMMEATLTWDDISGSKNP